VIVAISLVTLKTDPKLFLVLQESQLDNLVSILHLEVGPDRSSYLPLQVNRVLVLRLSIGDLIAFEDEVLSLNYYYSAIVTYAG
jgi:hypothetical protein